MTPSRDLLLLLLAVKTTTTTAHLAALHSRNTTSSLNAFATSFWAWRSITAPITSDDLPRTAVIRPPGWAPNVSHGSLLEQQVDYELFVHQVRGVGVRRATGCGTLQPVWDRRGRCGGSFSRRMGGRLKVNLRAAPPTTTPTAAPRRAHGPQRHAGQFLHRYHHHVHTLTTTLIRHHIHQHTRHTHTHTPRGCRIVHLVGVRLPNLENHQRRYMNE